MSYARDALERFVAIPSVAAEGRGITEAAAFTKALLEAEGMNVELHETDGAPVVYAELLGSGGPTVLFYNHYDVQPADPLELWESDPFTVVERGGNLYGRGTADDKGEIVSRLAALRLLKQKHGALPFNVKFVVEGEEEIGSPNLYPYIETHRERLAADACIWEYGGVDAAERPITYCGLKGILTIELFVQTAEHDVHSSYGAVVENAVYRMAAAVASLRDEQGRVQIEGFYDDVEKLSKADEQALAALPEEDVELAQVFGTDNFIGEASGQAFLRRLYFEPVLNINGLHGGYGGQGAKTIVPAQATAKLDFRLVPSQDPLKILDLLELHLAQLGFADIEVRRLEHFEHAARADVSHPFVQAAVTGLRDVFEKEPVLYPTSASSGPMYPFTHFLGVPVVGLGCGYPGSRIHSPNEHLRLDLFEKGILSVARSLERYVDLP